MSSRGERGPQGDHGQAGDTGPAGATGATGAQGPRGLRYSSWLTRRVTLAYSLVVMGVIAGFIVSAVLFDLAIDRINEKAREACVAGNERSRIQAEDFADTAIRTQALDLERLFGISPDAADELRRLTTEGANRRIASLPFLDCETGERLPVPPR